MGKNQKYKLIFGYSKSSDSISDDEAVGMMELEHKGGRSKWEKDTFIKSIKTVIRKYRGDEVCDEDGERGVKVRDVLPDGVYGFWVKVYAEDEKGEYTEVEAPMHCSYTERMVIFPGTDIRRVFRSILEFAGQIPWKLTINRIEINGEVYTNIHGIDCGRATFLAESGNDNVKVCMPYRWRKNDAETEESTGQESEEEDEEDEEETEENNDRETEENKEPRIIEGNISRISTEGLYVIEREERDEGKTLLLTPLGEYTVNETASIIDADSGESVPRSVELFYGIAYIAGGLKKGIFYYRDGKLVCRYAIDGTGVTYYLSDMKAHFYYRGERDISFKNEKSFMKRQISAFLPIDMEKDDLSKERAEEFEELFKDILLDKFIDENR